MPKYITSADVFDLDIDEIKRDGSILQLLEVASRYLGEINSVVTNVLEFDFILEALKNIEALNSARIEGTTGNLKDLYMEDILDFETKKQLKLFSAVNYRFTMNDLEKIVKTYKTMSLGLIRHLHKILTQHDPATKGEPGKFRLNEAKIINTKLGDFWPAHPTKIDEFMDKFVESTRRTNDFPSLLLAAISHYQFEAIHPFEDGNGRTGRVLINAQLLIRKTLKTPFLNISQYFDKTRDKYLSSLRSVSGNRSYKIWVKYFLKAIIEQSEHNKNLIFKLRTLREKNERLLNETVHSPAAFIIHKQALNNLFVTVPQAMDYLKKNRVKGDVKQMARNNVKKLEEVGILKKTSMKDVRADLYEYTELKQMLMNSGS